MNFGIFCGMEERICGFLGVLVVNFVRILMIPKAPEELKRVQIEGQPNLDSEELGVIQIEG